MHALLRAHIDACARTSTLLIPYACLAACLAERIATEATPPETIASCIGCRNPEILRVLLRKAVAPNLEERRRALAVISHLVIEQDFQAYVAMMVISEEPVTQLLCQPLHEYFIRCHRKNPRWKLSEPLHLALLRQQKAQRQCIDFSFLLKELRLSVSVHGPAAELAPCSTLCCVHAHTARMPWPPQGALNHVETEVESTGRGRLLSRLKGN